VAGSSAPRPQDVTRFVEYVFLTLKLILLLRKITEVTTTNVLLLLLSRVIFTVNSTIFVGEGANIYFFTLGAGYSSYPAVFRSLMVFSDLNRFCLDYEEWRFNIAFKNNN